MQSYVNYLLAFIKPVAQNNKLLSWTNQDVHDIQRYNVTDNNMRSLSVYV